MTSTAKQNRPEGRSWFKACQATAEYAQPHMITGADSTGSQEPLVE